jgi:hypothetical protein
MSYFKVFAELDSQIGNNEQGFCTAHIDSSIANLKQAIEVLEAAKHRFRSEVPDFVTCDRLDRLTSRTKNLLLMAKGQEIQLPRF